MIIEHTTLEHVESLHSNTWKLNSATFERMIVEYTSLEHMIIEHTTLKHVTVKHRTDVFYYTEIIFILLINSP